MKPQTETKRTPTRADQMYRQITEQTNFAELVERPEWSEIKARIVRAVNHFTSHNAGPDCQCSHFIPEQIDALLEAAKVREELLDQCVKLLALVRPDIHQEALDKIGFTQEAFSALFESEAQP